ncbi:MAG: hypothetical protein CMB70_06060 [Euryarchaeota archaeon]|nr:hypothetical protein [Euryarchaeota archaeon]
MMLSLLAPYSPLLATAQAEDVKVCCDAIETDLYLIGDSDLQLSPFTDLFSDSSSSASFETAVTSSEPVGKWILESAWPGLVPESTWTVEMDYTVTDAGGANLNLSATLVVGGSSFTGFLGVDQSFVAQGSGKVSIDIPVEEVEVNPGSEISLLINARTVVFSVPSGGAKVEFFWGSEEHPSVLTAELPIIDLTFDEPIVEGDMVYFTVRIDSPFGMEALVFSKSIELSINGVAQTVDPTEVLEGDSILVIWEWDGATGGEESVNVSVTYELQEGLILTGTTDFDIETFDGTGEGGGFYPLNEPLRTNGKGSPLDVSISMELDSEEGGLRLAQTTILAIDGEMAFWIRWGLDHLGDETIPLSPVLKNFDGGNINDEQRGSRVIENAELSQFENYMDSYYITFFRLGLGLESEDLIGDLSDAQSFAITLDLMGEDRVRNAPLKLRIDSLTPITSGADYRILSSAFMSPQPSPLWSVYDVFLTIETSAMTSFSTIDLKETDDVDINHLRFPWGESATIQATGMTQSDKFTIDSRPTTLILHAPIGLTMMMTLILAGGLWLSFRMVRNRAKYPLMIEMVLVPVVFALHFFALEPLYVLTSSGTIVFIWWATAMISPRTGDAKKPQSSPQVLLTNFPTIACPQCQTSNPVTSDLRPIRIQCSGCDRIIKIVS